MDGVRRDGRPLERELGGRVDALDVRLGLEDRRGLEAEGDAARGRGDLRVRSRGRGRVKNIRKRTSAISSSKRCGVSARILAERRRVSARGLLTMERDGRENE